MSSSRQPAGRDIHDEEIAAMLDPGDEPGPLEVRDTAVIAWLWSTGGRRAEAADQLIENSNRKERAVKIFGKGNRERTGYLHPEAAVYVGRWLSLVGERTGPMFRPVDRWGNIVPRHLSPGPSAWLSTGGGAWPTSIPCRPTTGGEPSSGTCLTRVPTLPSCRPSPGTSPPQPLSCTTEASRKAAARSDRQTEHAGQADYRQWGLGMSEDPRA
jgi:Phage integrase family